MATERILVIEDESGARTALERLLTEEGFSVRTAATGARGLEQIRDFRPDTIVCDFRLPDTTGLQVLRAARAASPKTLTFIVVTADCGGAEAERALRSEADYFFHKPVDLSTFYRVISRRKGKSNA